MTYLTTGKPELSHLRGVLGGFTLPHTSAVCPLRNVASIYGSHDC